MKRMRKSYVAAVAAGLLIAATIFLTGCAEEEPTGTGVPPGTTETPPAENGESDPGGDAAAKAGDPVAGGELTFGLATSPSGLDPNFVPGAVDYRVMRTMYDSLVVQLPDHTFQPWLATEWTVSDDGTAYTFKLREDVKFHDGTPFNAEAVKFNFDRIVDPATQSRMAVTLLGPYDSTEVIDEYTVKVNLKSPYVPFLNALSQAFLGMVSPAAVKKHGDNFAQNPVGTGPFKFVKWTPNAEIVVEKNPDYNWGPANAAHTGPAYLDRIVFKIVPEESTRVGSLQSGQIDVVETVPPQNMAAMENDPNIKLVRMNSTGAPHMLMLNQTKEPWNELKARQAVQLGIDMDTIINTLYMGQYVRAHSPLTPTTQFYRASLEGAVTYDPEKANQLLDELGWVKGPDGIRVKDGKKLTLRYLESTPNREKRQDIATMIQQQLKLIGIEVQVDILATGALLGAIQSNQYDLAGSSLVSGDPDVLRTMFDSKNAPNEQRFAFNLGHLNDPQMDEWLLQGLQESDLAKRENIYYGIQEYVVQNALAFPTYVFPYTMAMGGHVNGIGFDPLAYPLFYDAWIQK